MVEVIAVTMVLTLAGGGVLFLVFRREKQRKVAEFGRALRHALRSRKISEFDYAAFAEQAGVSRTVAAEAAIEVYGLLYDRAVADGKITDRERAKLDLFSTRLLISEPDRRSIEQRTNQSTYRERAQAALADGALSEEEAAELAELQDQLGLRKDDVTAATSRTGRDAYVAQFRAMLRRVVITQTDLDRLARLRTSVGLSEAEAFALVRKDALDAYRRQVVEVKQDGVVTEEEEAGLDLLQEYLGLPDHEVAGFRRELEWIKHLDRCRNGQLTPIRTDRLLESGELCYFDRPCTYVWETRTRTNAVEGELLVTERRIIFSSSLKSFEFSPSRIIDMQVHSNGLTIQTSSNKGKGAYLVDQADELEAILFALVRKQKFLAVEGFSSSASRHIPHDVKVEVWQRDGGNCVQCGATDYLEYDHIIPHAKGGASTVNNVQILCRRCNSIKSDRI